MNTDINPLDGSVETWLASFGYSTAHQFLQPGTLLWICALLVVAGIAAFAVASLSDIPPADAEGLQSAIAENAHVGDACAWACPWHGGLSRRRPIRLNRQPAAA